MVSNDRNVVPSTIWGILTAKTDYLTILVAHPASHGKSGRCVILRQIKYAQMFVRHLVCNVHFPTVQKHTGIKTIPHFYWKNDKRVEPANGIQPAFSGDSVNCSTDSRSWFNSQMPYDILPQDATTESREVRVSDTSHLTRPTEIQNSLAVAKPTADRAVPCRKSGISQQHNSGGAVSTQIGHAPVRLEAQGQTAVQCWQNEICSSRRIVAGQF